MLLTPKPQERREQPIRRTYNMVSSLDCKGYLAQQYLGVAT